MAFQYIPLAKQTVALRGMAQNAQAKAAANEANLYFAAMMAGIDLPEDESVGNSMEVTSDD